MDTPDTHPRREVKLLKELRRISYRVTHTPTYDIMVNDDKCGKIQGGNLNTRDLRITGTMCAAGVWGRLSLLLKFSGEYLDYFELILCLRSDRSFHEQCGNPRIHGHTPPLHICIAIRSNGRRNYTPICYIIMDQLHVRPTDRLCSQTGMDRAPSFQCPFKTFVCNPVNNR